MDRTSIVRVPIKIRRPIYKDFCECWDISVFSVEGIPHLINGDRLSTEQVEEFLNSMEMCVGLYFSEPIEKCKEKVLMALNMRLPVTIRTNRVLPRDVLEALQKVPHSGIHVSINFLDDFIRSRLENGASDISSLREMMFLAKSWKIFVALTVDYMPHLVPRLDLFELIDMCKNHISHMLIRFPDIPDETYYEHRGRWESLMPSSIDKFKQYYVADVPRRTWEIRKRYEVSILEGLSEFIRARKIGIEVLGNTKGRRVRHVNSGYSDLPLGIRPFFYRKDNGIFVETTDVEDNLCGTCGKPTLC